MTTSPRALTVFISYASEDEALREELEKQLAILRDQDLIRTWHKQRITAGREKAEAITAALEVAELILLLISPDFLASGYLRDVELTRAMERHEGGTARVIPIILRPCLWRRGSFAKLQALPTDGEPVTSLKWPTSDAAFLSIAQGIATVVDELAAHSAEIQPGIAGQLRQPVWNVPYRRNPNFTGREALLADLHVTLAAGQPAALTGLGGIGKTQLALEYAWRHRDAYSIVWWLRAEEPATLAADYAALAEALVLSKRKEQDQAKVVRTVRNWLERNRGWLLIFDNAPSREAVSELVPATCAAVILTSRSPIWSGLAQRLETTTMTPNEAVRFLVRRTGDTDAVEATALAEDLGLLPLALEQAAAYVETNGTTLASYRELFEGHHAELLGRGGLSTDYPGTVATTWALSIAQVDEASRALLELCAFLAPEAIPLDLITAGAEHLPEPLDQVALDAVALDGTVADLLRFSLVGRKGNQLSLHRLVQTVVRDQLTPGGWRRWAETAMAVVIERFPQQGDDVRSWPVCARLMPHALIAGHWVEMLGTAPKNAGHLFNRSGLYLYGRAEFTGAKTHFERALRLDEATYGTDHVQVSICLNNLGSVLQDLGDFTSARTYFERALRLHEAAYGPNHPKVAICLNNLGSVLQDLGDFAGAKAHFERALRLDEIAYGPDHPSVARDLNHVGLVLQDLGDFAGAKAHFTRALRLDEAAYGPNHPEVATDINNLGSALQDLGDLVGAKAHFKHALHLDESAYGPDHPTVAIRINNLGSVLRDLGDLAGAKLLFKRALRIDEAAYGPNHPTVARDVNNLGRVLQDLGDLSSAKAHFECALGIDEVAYGPNHPEVATDINNLGSVLEDLGDLAGARAHFERALHLDEAAYGPDHPTLAWDVNNLGRVLQNLGDLVAAKAHYERALVIFRATLGAQHPSTQRAQRNLDMVVKEIGGMPNSLRRNP